MVFPYFLALREMCYLIATRKTMQLCFKHAMDKNVWGVWSENKDVSQKLTIQLRIFKFLASYGLATWSKDGQTIGICNFKKT